MNIRDIFKNTGKYLTDNSPAVLTGVGVAGTVATAVLTGRATIQAVRIHDENREIAVYPDAPENLPLKETLKLVWPHYIPPVVVGTITVTSIIAANRVGTRRAAALAAAYTISERSFQEYREKVVERLGETKEQKVRDEIAQDQVDRNPVSNREIIISNNGEQLFFESYTGRYFQSTMEDVKKAMNDTNYHMFRDQYASLGDFQRRVGLPLTDISEEVGWTVDTPLDIAFHGVISDDQRPCIAIQYRVEPVRNYYRFR